MKYFAFIAMLFFPLSLSAQTMSEAEFMQKLRLASVYEGTRDIPNALRVYEELYKLYPNNQEVGDGYVRALYMLKRFSDLEQVLTDRVKHESVNSFDLYLLLGKTRAQLNHKSDAIEAFHKAESASPASDLFSVVIAVANAMIDVGYDEEALTMLVEHRKNSEHADYFTSEIAKLLFKMGRYDDGTKEYLALLRDDERGLATIQSRIAQFTADTSTRRTLIKTIISHIDASAATTAELRLLSWCYGELKDYPNALNIFLTIDQKTSASGTSTSGFELAQFADRALAEGAYETATKAYDESLKRLGPGDIRSNPFIFQVQLGSLKARQAMVTRQRTPPVGEVRDLINKYKSFASTSIPIDVAIGSLMQAGDLAFKQLHDPLEAAVIYEQIIKRSPSFGEPTRNAYFTLEEIALSQGDLTKAQAYLSDVDRALDGRNRPDDAENRRHVLFERARLEYFDGRFDSALAKLSTVMSVPMSDFANDAIALHILITENLNGSSEQAMKVFAKAELLALGSDRDGALTLYLSIKQTYPKAEIADEATLRAADLMVTMGKWSEALTMLDQMQAQMSESPLLDRAALREAQITDEQLVAKDKALKLYEDFLARFPKSPYTTVVRQRARTLRGDTF